MLRAMSCRTQRLPYVQSGWGLWRNSWDPYFQEAPKLIDAPESLTDVPARESRQFWVTVHAPPSAKAGNYTTTLEVRTAGGEVAKLKLKVQVLPFQLDQGMWWGVFYYPGFNASTPRDFADMKAHGVNSMLICPPGNREPVLTKQGDKGVASFPLADKAMAELNRQGFQRPVVFFPRMLSCRILRAVLDDVPEGSSSTSETKLDKLRETLATEIVKLISAGVSINP